MKKLIIGVSYQYKSKKNRGFTLIEVLLVISIIGIIMFPIGNYLNSIIFIENSIRNKDKLIREGKFGILFIDYEIRNSKKIYDVEEMKGYRREFDDFGFLIELDQGIKNQSTYILYYKKANRIRRRALNREANKCPNFSTISNNAYTGDNIILENIADIDVNYNKETNIISFCIGTELGKSLYSFRKDIYIYNMGRY